MKIENSTCEIASATLGTLFLCCVLVWTKIQERCCCFCFVIFTQRDMCQSRTLQHIHNMRREKRKKNDWIDESSKVERMLSLGERGSICKELKRCSFFCKAVNKCKICNQGERCTILQSMIIHFKKLKQWHDSNADIYLCLSWWTTIKSTEKAKIC